MTFAPGQRVLVKGLGIGTVKRADKRRIYVRIDGKTADYLARPENVERIPSAPPEVA